MNAYSTNEIARLNREAGGHWFDPDTLRFFSSIIMPKVFHGPCGVFFVSSERISESGDRSYSVRRFVPESAAVESTDERHDSRAAAYCAARRMAAGDTGRIKATRDGESDVFFTCEKFKPLSDAAQFEFEMRRELPAAELFHIRKLLRMAANHHRLTELICGDGSFNQDVKSNWASTRIVSIRGRISRLVRLIGAEPLFSGDPRGSTLRIRLPSGHTNSMHGDGWVVPIVRELTGLAIKEQHL